MGCVPATQDQDTWPAYASLILAETGAPLRYWCHGLHISGRVTHTAAAILLLTILKRFINGPICVSSSWFRPRGDFLTCSLPVEGCSEGVLVRTLYRDGELLGYILCTLSN